MLGSSVPFQAALCWLLLVAVGSQATPATPSTPAPPATPGGTPDGSTSATPCRALLVGYTGVGKSFFCNHVDGTVCEATNKCPPDSAESCTSSTYFGRHFVDSVGFGDNKVVPTPLPGATPALHPTLAAVQETLTAVNGTHLRALVWVMNCMNRKVPLEELRVAALMSKALGTSIPIVGLFNPNGPGLRCLRETGPFVAKAQSHGIHVREVYTFDSSRPEGFSVEGFEARFATAYPVHVPPTLGADLARVDPGRMSAELDRVVEHLAEARRLRCNTLPAHLETVRGRAAALRASKVSESDFPLCVMGKCDHIGAPQPRSCSVKFCADYKKSCRSCGGFVGKVTGKSCCSEYCAREEMRDDTACVAANAAAIKHSEDLLRQCISSSALALAACEEDRAARVAQARATNKGLAAQVVVLTADEASTLASMANCDKVL